MYKALVHLDYHDNIYHIPALNNQINLGVTSLMETVERTQYQAAKAITGTCRGPKLCEVLGWETLRGRRWCRRILQIQKIKNNLTLSYLRDKLPPNRKHSYRCK